MQDTTPPKRGVSIKERIKRTATGRKPAHSFSAASTQVTTATGSVTEAGGRFIGKTRTKSADRGNVKSVNEFIGKTTAKPAAKLAAKPAGKATTKHAAKLAAKPAGKPTAKPAPKLAAKPTGKPVPKTTAKRKHVVRHPESVISSKSQITPLTTQSEQSKTSTLKIYIPDSAASSAAKTTESTAVKSKNKTVQPKSRTGRSGRNKQNQRPTPANKLTSEQTITPATFTSSQLPAIRENIWPSLDIARSEPHYSPSFKALRMHKGTTLNLKSEADKAKPKTKVKALRVIPLSGLCEVGRNMTVLEYGNDMIIIDCGVSFPDDSHPGIDSIIPNMEYVFKNVHKLRGVFITHGHEDHIGALSWLMEKIDAPVYATPLPIELIRYKLEDRGIKGKDKLLRTVHDGDVIKAGCLSVEYIHVNHSIADACALAIRTPIGTVIHTGDFKIDYTPINGGVIDLPRLASIGSEGVLLLLCESTNIERAGFSPSEKVVGETFAGIFAEATGRVIVATFSSNVYRIQQIIDAAERHNRKVALIGRSMQNVFRAADSLGYIKRRADTIIDLANVDNYAPEELVIITTGSQGEPLAALTRMAFDEHRKVEINPSDTIIISATPIPGNEKPIYRVINELYKKGAKVIYSSLAHIHVSGHAYREEIKLIHELLRPKYFIPVHGEYRMLHLHAELAHEIGQPWDTIFILNNGDICQITENDAKIVGSFNAEPVLIDGKSATTLDNNVLESRKILAEEGIIVISLCVNKATQTLAAAPAIQTRGFVYQSDLSDIESETTALIHRYIKKVVNNNKPLADMLRSHQFRDQLYSLFYEKTSRRPIVLVSVLEV